MSERTTQTKDIQTKPTHNQSLSPVTRIYINKEGDLIVTDLWDEIKELLELGGFDANN